MPISTKKSIDLINSTATSGGSIEIKEEGATLTTEAGSIDFSGAYVTATEDGNGNVTVTITDPPGGGTTYTIQDEGVDLPVRTNINFVGSAVSVTDTPGTNTTTITITGGATNLSIANRGVSTLDVASSTGNAVTLPAATTSLTGLQTSADKTKLEGIEANADVTDADNVVPALTASTLISATVSGSDLVLIKDVDDNEELKTVTAQSIAALSVSIADEGASLPSRALLDFTGAGVTATDDSVNNKTIINIPGGGVGSGTNLEVINYSTQDEVVVPGKYFETSPGLYKPIYRKIIRVDSFPNVSTVEIPTGLPPSTLEMRSLDVKGFSGDNSTFSYNIPYPEPNTYLVAFYSQGNITLISNTNRSSESGHIRMEYAKVSDTAVSYSNLPGNGGAVSGSSTPTLILEAYKTTSQSLNQQTSYVTFENIVVGSENFSGTGGLYQYTSPVNQWVNLFASIRINNMSNTRGTIILKLNNINFFISEISIGSTPAFTTILFNRVISLQTGDFLDFRYNDTNLLIYGDSNPTNRANVTQWIMHRIG